MTSSDNALTVEAEINASTDAVFDVLSNPNRHVELDGSGFVISLEKGERITATGQQFVMNMTGDHMGGEYQTSNHVTGFDANHLLAWQTAPRGQEPPGWEWVWELEALGSDRTRVRQTYDWSKVEDQALLEKIGFPLVSQDQLEATMNRLDQAVTGS